MPRYPIDRATNFIIEEESWAVIEYDHTSVPGTIYLSLTENKVNRIYDDLINNIADTDKLANYTIDAPVVAEQFAIGDTIVPTFTFMKNGLPYDGEFIFTPMDTSKIKKTNGNLIGIAGGTTQIKVQLKDYPQISQLLDVEIIDDVNSFSAYIDGPDVLRLDREATYTLIGTDMLTSDVTFVLDND